MGNTTSKVIEISDSENEDETPKKSNEPKNDTTQNKTSEHQNVATVDNKLTNNAVSTDVKYDIIIDSDDDPDISTKKSEVQETSKEGQETFKTYYPPEFINIESFNKMDSKTSTSEQKSEINKNDVSKSDKIMPPKSDIKIIELFDDVMETDDIKDTEKNDRSLEVISSITSDKKLIESEIIDLDKNDLTDEYVEVPKSQHTITEIINNKITNMYYNTGDETPNKVNEIVENVEETFIDNKSEKQNVEIKEICVSDANKAKYSDEAALNMEIDADEENQPSKDSDLVNEIIPNIATTDTPLNYKNIQIEKNMIEDEVINLDDSGDSEPLENESNVKTGTSQNMENDLNLKVNKTNNNDNKVIESPTQHSNAKVKNKSNSTHVEFNKTDSIKAVSIPNSEATNVTSETQTKENIVKPNMTVPLNTEKLDNPLIEDIIIDLDANDNEPSETLAHETEKQILLCESKANDNIILKTSKVAEINPEEFSVVKDQQQTSDDIIYLDGNDINDDKACKSQIDPKPDIENEKSDHKDKATKLTNNLKPMNQSSEIAMETDDNTNIIIELDLDNNDEEISLSTKANAKDKHASVEIESNLDNTNIDSLLADMEIEVQMEKIKTNTDDIEFQSSNDVQIADNIEIKTKFDEETVVNKTEANMDVDDISNAIAECVNYHCSKITSITYPAPIFVLSYYRINKKSNKRQFVCDRCFDDCAQQYEQMTGDIIAHKPIVYKPKTQPDLIELSDSDEDDISQPRKKNIANDLNRNYIKNSESNRNALANLEGLIEQAFSKINIDMQLKKRTDIINKTIEKNKDMSTALFNDIRELQKSADKMHFTLYQKYPNRIIKELPPIDLNKEDKLNLPPVGEISYPSIQISKKYLAPRHAISGAWVECEALEMYPCHPSDPRKNGAHYKVMFCRRATKLVLSIKHIAYSVYPDVRLNVGTRVVAIFQQVPVPKQSFFPGTVGETLKESNKYRYLIFFDDGYCQYVKHEHVRLICEVSSNVWEDIDGNPGTSRFIQEFLSQFHNRISRPMLLAKRGQKIITEFNGIWKLSKVVDVDCNLIKMYIEKNQTFEWIYRGSSRFAPIFKHRQVGNESQLSALNYHLKKRNEPYIEMTLDEISDGNNQTADNNRVEEMQTDPKGIGHPIANRAVARKSTNQGSKTFGNNNNNSNGATNKAPVYLNNSVIVVDDDKMPKGKVTYYETTKRYSAKTYTPHTCTTACIVRVEDNLEPFNPIARPLLSGWERQICKYKSRKIAIYRAPCGRRLRAMPEVHQYLRLTNNPLNVECFDYDTTMHCLAEYTDLPQYIRNTDLSDGTEKMPISCCNYFDKTTPPTCTYSTNRIPTDGVNLNLDPDFLCACDCEDDCIDKTKCQCWQLTIKGARSINSALPIDEIGYCFKRLLNPIPTGIYECNSRCKCKQNCLNRVVQHPLGVKLQVFKTTNRGWGLRTLHDIPKGSFICIYAGDLLTEQSSNDLGAKEGDEYFAELDYIEAVEGLKEGYESDIPREEGDDEPEGERDDDFENSAESDDDDFTSKCKAIDKKITTRSSTRSAKNQDKKSSSSRPSPTTVTTSSVTGAEDDDCITISDDEEVRAPVNFIPNTSYDDDTEVDSKYKSVRKLFGKDELGYVMDAKRNGNIGRYFNHSCNPNLFVQNVFVDTHDLRFPWVTFFSNTSIQAGTELTWNYNYDVGCVPGKVLYCQCDSSNCRGRLL